MPSITERLARRPCNAQIYRAHGRRPSPCQILVQMFRAKVCSQDLACLAISFASKSMPRSLRLPLSRLLALPKLTRLSAPPSALLFDRPSLSIVSLPSIHGSRDETARVGCPTCLTQRLGLLRKVARGPTLTLSNAQASNFNFGVWVGVLREGSCDMPDACPEQGMRNAGPESES